MYCHLGCDLISLKKTIMVSLDVSQGVFRNGYLAQGVWAEGRELMISAQISWLENVACSSHELALTQPDLLQK